MSDEGALRCAQREGSEADMIEEKEDKFPLGAYCVCMKTVVHRV
jgi:hypothetical protein